MSSPPHGFLNSQSRILKFHEFFTQYKNKILLFIYYIVKKVVKILKIQGLVYLHRTKWSSAYFIPFEKNNSISRNEMISLCLLMIWISSYFINWLLLLFNLQTNLRQFSAVTSSTSSLTGSFCQLSFSSSLKSGLPRSNCEWANQWARNSSCVSGKKVGMKRK